MTMTTVEDIRFGQRGVCLAHPELLVKMDANLLVQQYDVHVGDPQSAMTREEMSVWVSEAAAALHAFAALSARLDLRIDPAAVMRLANAYPDFNALLEHSHWSVAARDMLASCAAAIARDEQEFWTATNAWYDRRTNGRRPVVFRALVQRTRS